MRNIGIALAFLVTPFIALFWACVTFYVGWVEGWRVCFDEARK